MFDRKERRSVNTLFIAAMLMVFAGSACGVDANAPSYSFPGRRSAYRLDLTPDGTRVTHRVTGNEQLVPYGESMLFANYARTSKNTQWIIRHAASHAETYVAWEECSELPVDYLRTAAYSTWNGRTPIESMEQIDQCPYFFPDTADKVVVAYVNLMEFTGIDGWDFAFDPVWDANGDAIIDAGIDALPAYVDPKVFNEPWKNYVAAYWTEAWKRVLERKIDLCVEQNFDGLMLDVMTGYWTWFDTYPEMNVGDLRQKSVDLIKSISDYAKNTYGDSFVVTANLDHDTNLYFDDLGSYVDGGYYQNAYFRWDGSGIVDGQGLSESEDGYANRKIDFLRAQGFAPLSMEHLGTGQVSEGLEFENYDARITDDRLLGVFRWAVESGTLPFVTQLFMKSVTYESVPRFCRVNPETADRAMTPYDDWVIGSDHDDRILTGAGNDLMYGGAGNDSLLGGAGVDRVLYDLPSSQYEISFANGTVTVSEIGGHGYVDTLEGVEGLVFADKAVPLSEG